MVVVINILYPGKRVRIFFLLFGQSFFTFRKSSLANLDLVITNYNCKFTHKNRS